MYETCQRYPIEGLVHTVERRIAPGWRYNLGVQSRDFREENHRYEGSRD